MSCTYSSNGEFIFVGTRDGSIDVYKAPCAVERLIDICRRTVNQLVERENIEKLDLPKDVENYLSYDDIQPINKSEKTNRIPQLSSTPLFDVNQSNINFALSAINLLF